ncbi:MAG: SDR family oxidoreductase [Bacteroidales bacterium]|nr:SDR family oxidoreductase [Bacteroidales bacterium]
MSKLKDKVAVITGASSGIGKAVAETLAKEGVKCLVTARREEQIKDLAHQINGFAISADIIKPEVPNQLLQAALDTFGRCDILLNNAGNIHVGAIEDVDIEKIAGMVRINVEAAYRLIYTFLKQFKKQGSGHVINISSVMGTKVRATAGAYGGTKYAIEGLSEALRMELTGTKIKISNIQPGLVMTELHNDWEEHPSKLMDIKEPLQPEDVANQVVYILKQPDHIRIPRLMILPDDHNI